jgi:ADP-dependent NAD(P)H-hydrate dehydratase
MNHCRSLDARELRRHPLPPVVEGDKNSRGKLLVIAGTREIAGAARICANAALRAGAGKITIATVASVAPQLGMAVPEARVVAIPETREGGFANSAVVRLAELTAEHDAVVAGPGMSPTPVATSLAASLCPIGRPLVLDAALLHGLPRAAEHARSADIPPILLPHSGEMASLIGCSAEEVEENPLACGYEAARRYDALVLVKGPESHIVTPAGGSWKYQGGGPGLGVSGSGDTLAGILGGLLARGSGPLEALLWSVWLHGEAGASLARKIGPIGFFAREIAGEVPGLLAKTQASAE